MAVRRTALLTGATGFVGSHLAAALAERGWAVTCLVRRTSDTRWLRTLPVELRVADLMGQDPDLPAVIAGHEVVFHVAGAVRALDAAGFRRINAQLTEDLLHACLEAPAPPRRFVLVSSVAALGPRPGGGRVSDDGEPRPVSDYGRSKLEGEQRAAALADRIEVVIVRPSAIYGPRDREMLPLFRAASRGLAPALGGGKQVVNLCHVADIVDGIILAGGADVASGRGFILGAAEERSVAEAGRILCALFGRRPHALSLPRPLLVGAALAAEGWARVRGRPAMLTRQKLPELIADWRLDIGRARAELGYAPRFGLEAGLSDTLAWYRRERWLPEGAGA